MVVGILGGLAFFALIIASVLLHELGHLIPAKIFGIRAPEYFAGFGPKIWGKRVGETEYGLRWLPLGGYVRLLGMYPPRREGARPTWLQRLADTARDAERADILPADDGRLFYQAKTWQKLIVMAGGILTNLLLSFVLFWGVFGIHGTPQYTTLVSTVQQCMVPAERADKTCTGTDPQTPAAKAGMRTGDRIVAFNGREVSQWDTLSGLIRANGDAAATVVVEREGRRVTLPTVTTSMTGANSRAGYLGVSPRAERVRLGPVQTLARMWDMSVQSLEALALLPVKVYRVAADMIESKPRDTNSPMSIVGASRVAGEVASSELRVTDKLAVGASLLGGLNLFLFWLNVIPLPPLDGGHIAGALYEWLRRVVARWRGKPDPGPFDTAKMLPVAYTVGAMLLVLGAVLVLADIISPVHIF